MEKNINEINDVVLHSAESIKELKKKLFYKEKIKKKCNTKKLFIIISILIIILVIFFFISKPFIKYTYQKYINISQVRNNITQVSHNITQVNHNITQISHDFTQVNHNITQISHNITQINHNITQVNHNITQVNHNITQISHNITQISHNITQVNHNITQVNHNITQVNHNNYNITQINNNKTQVNQNITQVNNNITQLSNNNTQENHNITQVNNNKTQVNNNITQQNKNRTQVNNNIINANQNLIDYIDNITSLLNQNLTNKDKWKYELFVMHALGGYNKTIYTNSYEGLNYYYLVKKMKLMEADFQLTNDSHIVTAHDYSAFNHRIPSFEEFNNSRTNGNLTPMTFEDLVIYMYDHKDLYIITDTKYTDLERIEIEFNEMTEILSKYEDVNERFIIEIYNERMYEFLRQKNYPFNHFLFTLYQRLSYPYNFNSMEEIFKYCKENGIEGIIMWDVWFNNRISVFSQNYSIPVYLHTVNDIEKVVKLLNQGAKAIFTDYLNYEVLEEYLKRNNLRLLY